ncbi:DUF1742-domain-containing protein [Ceratobasidium sp. AG-I]|nr:DUF1742-domain-containing protein [Ceratobasidium sp. AG-I]
MSSTPFQNLYYKRAVATARACYVCYKPTTTVLATSSAVDCVYTCDTHLSDPNFAVLQAPAPSASPSVNAEEIARIKEEWEAKQKRKKEEAEKAKKEAEEKKDGEKDKKDETTEKAKVASPKPASPAPVASGSATPKHDKYVLHRQFFTMRLTDHRRQRQKKEVDVMAPKLTGVGLNVPRQVG